MGCEYFQVLGGPTPRPSTPLLGLPLPVFCTTDLGHCRHFAYSSFEVSLKSDRSTLLKDHLILQVFNFECPLQISSSVRVPPKPEDYRGSSIDAIDSLHQERVFPTTSVTKTLK